MKKLLFIIMSLASASSFAVSVGEIYDPTEMKISILNRNIAYEVSGITFTGSKCTINSNQRARVMSISGKTVRLKLIGRAQTLKKDCPNSTEFKVSKSVVNNKFNKVSGISSSNICQLSQNVSTPILGQNNPGIATRCTQSNSNIGDMQRNRRGNRGQASGNFSISISVGGHVIGS